MKTTIVLLGAIASTSSWTNQFADPEVRPNVNYEFEVNLPTALPKSCVEARLNGGLFVIDAELLKSDDLADSPALAQGKLAFSEASSHAGTFCSRVAKVSQYSPETTFIINAIRKGSGMLFRPGATEAESKAIVQFVSGRSSGDINLKFVERNLGDIPCVLAKAMWWFA